MEADYCVICQEAHQMNRSCLQNVRCKSCGMRGHLRIDCTDQDLSAEVEENGCKSSVNQREHSSDKQQGSVVMKFSHSDSHGWEIPGQGGAKTAKAATTMTKTKSLTTKQKKQIIHECVEDQISPTNLAKKWQCNADTIRTWVRKAGKQLPKQYKKSMDTPEPNNTSLKLTDDLGSSSGHDDIARRGIKRKNITQVLTCPSKSARSMSESGDDPSRVMMNLQTHISHEPEPAVVSPKIPESEYLKVDPNSIIICLDSSEDECDKDAKDSGNGDANGIVICISDEEENNPNGKDDSLLQYKFPDEAMEPEQNCLGPNLEDQFKMSCESQENLKLTKQNDYNNVTHSEVESKHQDHKLSALKAGTFHIVSVHIELFRSSKSSSTKLTQIGCVVSGLNPSLFFKAIKPCGVEKYLDNYKLGGDLLLALHMTREDDGTFLFRSRFDIIEEDKKIVCIEESKALKSFLSFLENFPNTVILGVDEDTVSILVKKLKDVNEEKFNEIVRGFTYWKRVLKYLDIDGYKTIDLEEYYSKMIGEDMPSFTIASDIASVLLKSVNEVTTKEKEGKKSLDSHFYKLCKMIECISHPRKYEYDRNASGENVEVFSSFRPSVSATFSADKLEQVILSSESDSEPEETGRSNTENIVDSGRGEKVDSYSSNIIPPISIKALLSKMPPTAPLKMPPTSPMSDSWQIGEPTPNEGTVVCPSRCNTRLRYSRVTKHLNSMHPRMLELLDSLLCPFCKKLVSSSALRVHMPRCSATATASTAPSDQPSQTSQYTALNSAQLISEITRPGLSVMEDGVTNGQAFNALKIFLDSYLLTNFVQFSCSNINCLWMYKNYQETTMSQGYRESFSPAKFMLVVNELAMAHWKIDVGPVGIKQRNHLLDMETFGHLYFKGFKKQEFLDRLRL